MKIKDLKRIISEEIERFKERQEIEEDDGDREGKFGDKFVYGYSNDGVIRKMPEREEWCISTPGRTDLYCSHSKDRIARKFFKLFRENINKILEEERALEKEKYLKI